MEIDEIIFILEKFVFFEDEFICFFKIFFFLIDEINLDLEEKMESFFGLLFK